MARFALGIEYRGVAYSGWQRQPHADSIQERVEFALSQVADHAVETVCAGRTDAGVHALGQVVHFDTKVERPDKAWVMGVNTHLPDDIRVRWVKLVDEDFSARFSATARHYWYWINNKAQASAVFTGASAWHYQQLDAHKMHQAAQYLLGEQDFSTFRAAQCQSKTAMRNVIHCRVSRHNDLVLVDIKANAFLHHMVRNIVGSLLLIGEGREPVEWLASILEVGDRNLAGPTAPANGLYLFGVDYPQEFPKAQWPWPFSGSTD